MGTLSSLASGIKSIQRGTTTPGASITTGTITISSVNTAKTLVFSDGIVVNGGSFDFRVVLTNATTLTWTTDVGTTSSSTFSWQVVEFN